MNKIIIKQPEKERDYIGGLEEQLKNCPLIFIPEKDVRMFEHEIGHAGYVPAVVKVLGQSVGIVMKSELRGAIIDPSEDDLHNLTSALGYYVTYASAKYGEKGRIPSETSLGRFIEDSMISSLISNIIKYPTNRINSEKMRTYGLDQRDVLDLANLAYQSYCRTTGQLAIGSGVECLDSVGASKQYSGSSDSIDLASDVCYEGSHWKLKLELEKIQKQIQKELPMLSEEYQSLETRAVKLMMNHNSDLTEQLATNLFRMYINLGGLYNHGKALPIK